MRWVARPRAPLPGALIQISKSPHLAVRRRRPPRSHSHLEFNASPTDRSKSDAHDKIEKEANSASMCYDNPRDTGHATPRWMRCALLGIWREHFGWRVCQDSRGVSVSWGVGPCPCELCRVSCIDRPPPSLVFECSRRRDSHQDPWRFRTTPTTLRRPRTLLLAQLGLGLLRSFLPF